MEEIQDSTPSPEVKEVNATPEKVGDLIQNQSNQEHHAKQTVGLDKFLEIKKQNKELASRIHELENKVTEKPNVDISKDLASIAERYDVDKSFLAELSEQLERKAEEKADEKLRPLYEKEEHERFNKVFDEHYNRALERNPEFKEISVQGVIRDLALLPKNKDKTFEQLLDENYSHLVKGRSTMDTTSITKESEPLDFQKARSDSEYFKTVMSNKELKAQYNAEMLRRS
jgi:uncharacterized phage infection (PIP) family protein YhgE